MSVETRMPIQATPVQRSIGGGRLMGASSSVSPALPGIPFIPFERSEVSPAILPPFLPFAKDGVDASILPPFLPFSQDGVGASIPITVAGIPLPTPFARD